MPPCLMSNDTLQVKRIGMILLCLGLIRPCGLMVLATRRYQIGASNCLGRRPRGKSSCFRLSLAEARRCFRFICVHR